MKQGYTEVLSYKGEEHSIEEWACIFGLDKEKLISKLEKNDFSLEKALSSSGEKRERVITYKGKTQNLKSWAEELGLPYYCLRSRLNNMHWTVEQAFTAPYEGGNKNGKFN